MTGIKGRALDCRQVWFGVKGDIPRGDFGDFGDFLLLVEFTLDDETNLDGVDFLEVVTSSCGSRTGGRLEVVASVGASSSYSNPSSSSGGCTSSLSSDSSM